MNIFIERTSEKKKIRFTGVARALVEKLGLNPEAVLISRNGALLTLDDSVVDTDSLEILSVVSGG